MSATISLRTSATNHNRAAPRLRRTLLCLIALGCFLVGSISVGSAPFVHYLGEATRRMLATRNVFVTYGSIARSGVGVVMQQVSIRVPSYQVAEHFDSLSLSLNLPQLLHLHPAIDVAVQGLGGTMHTSLSMPWSGEIAVQTLSLEQISLKQSSSLAPLALSDGTISATMSQAPSESCQTLPAPCYAISFKAQRLEKLHQSELAVPLDFRKSFALPGYTFGSSITIPPFPRTDLSATIGVSNARTIISSATLRTDGVQLDAKGEVPVGTGGTSSIGWYEKTDLNGYVRLNKTLAQLSHLLGSPWVEGRIEPEKDTQFTLSGTLLNPHVVFSQTKTSRAPSTAALKSGT